jgi:hypothetical protein
VGDNPAQSITSLRYAKAPYTIMKNGVYIHPTVTELFPTLLSKLKPLG